jgi:hypothetical protein
MPFVELVIEAASLWDKVCVVRGDLANLFAMGVRDDAGLLEVAMLMTPLADMPDLAPDDHLKADLLLPLLGCLQLVLVFSSYLG